ncbi:hypothetical protein NE626_16155, partial [Intestinimonas massiliensis]|nr:hypothetical protein [Intestinimonas massiliensis (ex Afouda et al. 2020)]
TDEVIAYDGNRSNIICGIRNLILSLIAPYGAVLSGPLWGAAHVSILERYKHGRKDMDSIFGGLFSLNTALMLGTIWMGVSVSSSPVYRWECPSRCWCRP